MAVYTPATSNTVTSPFDAQYVSLYSAQFKPDVMSELFHTYGKQFEVIDFLRMAGKEISMKRDEMTSFALNAYNRPVKVKTAVAALTGGEFQFYIAAADYDTNNDTFVRIGDTIHIPGAYFSKEYDVLARVYEVGATDAALTKAKLLESGLTWTGTFPANGYLQVGSTTYGRGSDQPSAKSRGQVSDTFYTQISKETTDFDGGVQAQQLYVTPQGGLWGMSLADAEFALDYQQSVALWQGTENSNSVTETNARSETTSVRGTQGMWLHADANGQDHEYIDNFTVKDLDAVDELFKATGVIAKSAAMMVGHTLFKQVQDAAHDYIAQYSGGTDLLYMNMKAVGFTPVQWNRAGIDYKLINLAQLSDHQTFGANQKNFWVNAGLVIPDEQVTIEDKYDSIYNSEGRTSSKVSLPNVCIGYLQNNTEDRKRIVQPVAGVNGLGYGASNTYDRVQMAFLSEYALVANETQKWIRLMKDGTN
jgi:hypothetical protein